MTGWSACDFSCQYFPALKCYNFNTSSCKPEIVSVSSINESVISSESPVSASSQFDQFATDMNLVVLDDKFEVNFWEFEGPLSFDSFQEEFDGCMSDDVS